MQQFFDAIDGAFDARILPEHQSSRIAEILPTLTNLERLFFKFVVGNVPLQDLDSISPDILLKMARHAIRVRDESIPIQIYMNYVTMPRVNNEYLEFYHEFFTDLYQQIKDLPFQQRVQQINLYCFQLATYQGTDMRTLGPLHLQKASLGRCGEESTLLVSALRACGVPARQIYVPRWAHCDDNHAWVEIFGERRWWFTGACEPQPVLNLGWFNFAASRAPLIHTRAFSVFDCGELVVRREAGEIYLNVTQRYAELTQLDIQVANTENADYVLRFQLVNLAEIYNLYELTSAGAAITQYLSKGEYLVEFQLNDVVQQKKIDLRSQYQLCFDVSQGSQTLQESLELSPPFGQYDCEPEVSAEQKQQFQALQNEKEQLRNEYKQSVQQQIEELQLNGEILQIVQKSLGNFGEIVKFWGTAEFSEKQKLILLKSLSDKDLFDVSAEVLLDFLRVSVKYQENELYEKHIVAPRVFFEHLTPCYSYFEKCFTQQQIEEFRTNPESVMELLNSFVELSKCTYSELYSTVEGFLSAKRGTKLTKDVTFVKICRFLGVPAYYDPAYQESWCFVSGAFKIPCCQTQYVKVRLDNTKNVPFSLARKLESNNFKNLCLDYIKGFQVEEGIYELVIPAGSYRLMEGNRYSNGKTTSRISYRQFSEDTSLILSPVQLIIQKQNIAMPSISAASIKGKELSDLLAGKLIVTACDVGQEPTQHLLQELYSIREPQYDVAVFLRDSMQLHNEWLTKVIAKYQKIHIYVNYENVVKQLCDAVEISQLQYPLIISNEANVITHFQQGYCVGSVDQAILHI